MTYETPHVLAFAGGSELLILGAIILLLFGGSQIPKLARSLGQAQKEFKAGQEAGSTDDEKTEKAKESDA